jgi:hypothetical protein
MNREEVQWGRNGVPWPKDKATLNWDKIVIPKRFLNDR